MPRFQKGVCPNPGGRPKIVSEIIALCREACPDAVERVVALLREAEDPHVILAAATFLCDRGIGKPTSAELAVESLTDAQLVAEIRRRTEKQINAPIPQQALPSGGSGE